MIRAFLSTAVLWSLIATAAPTVRAATTPEILKSLPAGDAVVVIEPKSFFGKVLPAALARLPEYRTKADAARTSMKTDFGVDLESLRSVGISAFVGADAATSWVAVMTGDFGDLATGDGLAKRLAAYGEAHPRYSVRQQMHDGTAVFVLPETQSPGVIREEIAVALVDSTTLAYGTPAAVEKALDVRLGKHRAAASVASLTDALALSDPAAALRFGMPAPEALLAAEMKRDASNPFLKTLMGIRSLFGSLTATADGASLTLTARASVASQTESLAAVMSALVELGQQATGSKPELAALFDRMTVTTAAPDATLTAKF